MSCQTDEETPVATLWVPKLPAPRDRKSPKGAQRWHEWFRMVCSFATYARVPMIDSPVRCHATVCIADPLLQRDFDWTTMKRWAEGVREAVVRSGWVPETCLLGVAVRYETPEGVPAREQPQRTGTLIRIYVEE